MANSRTFPIAIIVDCYGGVYSGGAWLAVSCADAMDNGAYRIIRCLEDGPHGDDVEASQFLSNPPPWIVSADTPDRALRKLQDINARQSLHD
jgi:hypothetical protein